MVAALSCKGDQLGVSTTVRTAELYKAYQILAETISLPTPRNKAIFGTNAFATQAGIHQAGILRNPITYEFINPLMFGRTRSLLIGRHSGRAILRHLLGQLGIPADDALVDDLYEQHIASRPDSECDELDMMRGRLAAQLGEQGDVHAGAR
jgi:2-isopropylmalate synthase